jgi:dihydrofolate reductase
MGGPWEYADDGRDTDGMHGADRECDGGVSLGGGADLIRQGLAAGVADELAISTAPLVLSVGKRLFEGFEQDIDLEVLGTWSSQYATVMRGNALTLTVSRRSSAGT